MIGKRGRVGLLWHLHQPDVRDPATGAPRLPWVRHHALRGYHDIVSESLANDDAVTLNFSGVLLAQLRDVCLGGAADPLRAALAADPGDLAPEERFRLVRLATAGHPVLRRPWINHVGADPQGHDGRMRDLLVWSALQWFGRIAAAEEPSVAALREKGRGFRREDQDALVAAQDAVLARLWARIGQLGGSRVGVSASPFHHPILPLLVDTAHARRSLPDVEDVGFRRPEDALRDLIDGREAVSAAVGRDVSGLWPSEGAVSPESMTLARQAGFRWFASDELVRAQSTCTGAGCGPWTVEGAPLGFFRDHLWSDRIGFDAVRLDPDDVARQLAAAADASTSLVVALDGENPWEAYPDAGAALRDALRHHLGDRRATLDEMAADPPHGSITTLHTGSWVDGTLAIWYGHAEDRHLWHALRRARDACTDPSALAHLRVLEGSDWTWWTGAEFDTPFRSDYERLFRDRLAAALGTLSPPSHWRDLPTPGGAMAASRGRFRVAIGDGGVQWVEGQGWLREGLDVRPLAGPCPTDGMSEAEVATDPDGPWTQLPTARGALAHRHVVRLREVDAAGIAFFGRVFEIAHDAWEEVVRRAGHPMSVITGASAWKLPLVHAEADFRRPLRLGDEIDVHATLTGVRRTSLTVAFTLRRGDTVLAEVRTVHAAVDATTFQPCALDAGFVDALRAVVG